MIGTTERSERSRQFTTGGRAPFLVWPVARREFYLTLQFALVPTLLWGMIVFGWRVIILLAAAAATATVVHAILYRLTRRGKRLVYAHSMAAVFIMVALCHPMWPAWIVATAGGAIPAAFWTLGGPGRERIHVAVVWVILLQLGISWAPVHLGVGATRGDTDAVLARDRLLMGDIRNHRDAPLYRWPSSVDVGGDDAARVRRPQQVALDTLDHLSEALHTEAPINSTTAPIFSTTVRQNLQRFLDGALSSQLPAIEALIIGVVPGRVGTVSLAGILLGGLYLAYRHILRPQSVWLFLCTYAAMMAAMVFWPTTVAHLGIPAIYRLWRTLPAELLTLLEYTVLNSDVFFAAVFILAFPGTEPLTGRGRRVFLIAAGCLAATLDRMNMNIPAATVAVCLLMPLASMFDHLFAKPSWLTRVY